MKTCFKCSLQKDESEFELRPDTGKLRRDCHACILKQKRDRYHNLPGSRRSPPRLDGFKECSKCKFLRVSAEFHLHKGVPSGWCKPCKRAGVRKWEKENPEEDRRKARRYALKSLFGLTPEEWQKINDSQGGVCAICKGVSDKALCVDHSHKTGKVRGLLCGKCNRALGLLQDSPEITLSATEYLKSRA